MRQLEGDTDAPTRTIEFKGLDGGTYEVTAVVYRTTGESGRDRQRVMVADGHVN